MSGLNHALEAVLHRLQETASREQRDRIRRLAQAGDPEAIAALERQRMRAGQRHTDVQPRELAAWERSSMRDYLRRRRGIALRDLRRKPLGLKIGQKYWWNGEQWLLYDTYADSTAPRGITLVLVSPDFRRAIGNVRLDAKLHNLHEMTSREQQARLQRLAKMGDREAAIALQRQKRRETFIKLTPNERNLLNLFQHYSESFKPVPGYYVITSTHGYYEDVFRTMRALIRKGLVTIHTDARNNESRKFAITTSGKAALARSLTQKELTSLLRQAAREVRVPQKIQVRKLPTRLVTQADVGSIGGQIYAVDAGVRFLVRSTVSRKGKPKLQIVWRIPNTAPQSFQNIRNHLKGKPEPGGTGGIMHTIPNRHDWLEDELYTLTRALNTWEPMRRA